MKIGIDSSRACVDNWGGQENYAYYLIRALEKADLKNTYTLYSHKNPVRRLAEAENFTLKVMKFPRLWTQLRLAAETFKADIDVLFIPVHTIPYIKKPGLKTVVTVHDLSYELTPEQYSFPGVLYLKHYMRYSAKHATQVIAVSESTKKDLINFYQTPEERITVVPEGYDNKVFKVLDENIVAGVCENYDISGPYIFNVGTIQPRKNIVRLIEAFSEVKKHSNLVHTLIIAGKPGWKNQDIYAAPEKYGVAESVRFLGHVPDEDLPALINGADLFVYPSLYEGFGLPVIEAMACGTPVITSNTSSLPEAAGDAGILIDPKDAEQIAGEIAKLVTDKEKKDKLREKGIKWAKRFSWEQAALGTIEVIEKVGLYE